MKKIYKYIWILLFLCSPSLFAFNGRKCDSLLRKKKLWGLPSFLTTSSAQFTTSTGECAALGKSEDQKKIFYYVNIEHLKLNIAQGKGEYLAAFLEMNECSQEASVFLKNQFRKYFSNNEAASFEFLRNDLKPYCLPNS